MITFEETKKKIKILEKFIKDLRKDIKDIDKKDMSIGIDICIHVVVKRRYNGMAKEDVLKLKRNLLKENYKKTHFKENEETASFTTYKKNKFTIFIDS